MTYWNKKKEDFAYSPLKLDDIVKSMHEASSQHWEPVYSKSNSQFWGFDPVSSSGGGSWAFEAPSIGTPLGFQGGKKSKISWAYQTRPSPSSTFGYSTNAQGAKSWAHENMLTKSSRSSGSNATLRRFSTPSKPR